MSDGTKIDIEQKEKTVIDIMLCTSTAMHCCLGFLDNGTEIELGSYCMVETEKGMQLARALSLPYKMKKRTQCRQKQVVKIVRLATDADINKFEQRLKKEKETYQLCREKVEEQEVQMKIVIVEYHPEDNTYFCFYTAEKRIDCRELAKDLTHQLKAKIELRQIGARDEGSLLGGIGSCGYQLCCTMFSIDDLPSVSMKMAKAQNLALNPTRISGLCGRLMCCLAYEFDAYKDNIKAKGKTRQQEEDSEEEPK
jgi:cell fate regulator YaaT (PSP1 superfamily)